MFVKLKFMIYAFSQCIIRGIIPIVNTKDDPGHIIAQAKIFGKKRMVVFYLKNPYWRFDSYYRYQFNFLSTNNEFHVIRHELGHHHHIKKSGITNIYKYFQDVEIDKKLITNEVSIYAATNRGEFVAEVYAGIWDGKKYSNEIMNYYNKLLKDLS